MISLGRASDVLSEVEDRESRRFFCLIYGTVMLTVFVCSIEGRCCEDCEDVWG